MTRIGTAVICVALAVVGCGKGNDDGGGGSGGKAGSGGAGGSGGSGGSGGQQDTPCNKACANIYETCHLTWSQGVDEAGCVSSCQDGSAMLESGQITCLAAAACTTDAAALVACIVPPVCVQDCDHIYDDCKRSLSDDMGMQVSKPDCYKGCAKQFSDAARNCLVSAECTVDGLNACFAL